MVTLNNVTSNETTLYANGVEIVSGDNTGKTHNRYLLSAYGKDVAEVILDVPASGNPTLTTTYMLTDHIGSVDVVTDSAGNPSGTQVAGTGWSYDAFGKRRSPATWLAPQSEAQVSADRQQVTHRGFTGHEDLDGLGLVHMNGRVYDPNLGRFLSVDPEFQFPTNTQSLNPYSYVLNNPLSYTDPTGYMLGCNGDYCIDPNDPSGTPQRCMNMTCRVALAANGTTNGNNTNKESKDEPKKKDLKAGDAGLEDHTETDKLSGNQPKLPEWRAVPEPLTARVYDSLGMANLPAKGALIIVGNFLGSWAALGNKENDYNGVNPFTQEPIHRVDAWNNRLGDVVGLVVSFLTPGVGAAAESFTSRSATQLAENKAAGTAFEKAIAAKLSKTTDTAVIEQVTMRTDSGVKVRMDFVTMDKSTGKISCIECKSSPTAPLTKNQKSAFPEISRNGATVVGQGKPGLPSGTIIPPNNVEVVRPPL